MEIKQPIHSVRFPKEVLSFTGLPEYRVSVFQYLDYNQTWNGQVQLSPNGLIRWCGYTPSPRRGSRETINTKFGDCVSWFAQNEYVRGFDLEKYKKDTSQFCLLAMDKMRPIDNYGEIYDFELEAIASYKSAHKPLNQSVLILLLAYIRAFTWKGYGKPEIFHSRYKDIGKYTGISARLVPKAIGALVEMGILQEKRMPSYSLDNAQWQNGEYIYVSSYKVVQKNNAYCFCGANEYDWKRELNKGVKYLRLEKEKKK